VLQFDDMDTIDLQNIALLPCLTSLNVYELLTTVYREFSDKHVFTFEVVVVYPSEFSLE